MKHSLAFVFSLRNFWRGFVGIHPFGTSPSIFKGRMGMSSSTLNSSQILSWHNTLMLDFFHLNSKKLSLNLSLMRERLIGN